MDELTIGDKTYISSKKAAQITGYAKDYVGQLCREGHVEARMVGRNWYVLESSIRAHRFGAPDVAEVKATEPEAAAPSAEETLVETPVEEASDSLMTWKAPVYAAEQPISIPEVNERKSINVLDHPRTIEPEPLTDMQKAWREWFDTRKGETYLETPEIIDAREELYEAGETAVAEEVPAPSIEEAPEPVTFTTPASAYAEPEQIEESVEEPVVIHRQQATYSMLPHEPARAVRAPQHTEPTQVLKKGTRTPKRSNVSAARTNGGGGTLILRTLLVIVMLAALAGTAVGTGYAERYLPQTSSNTVLTKYLGGTRIIDKSK